MIHFIYAIFMALFFWGGVVYELNYTGRTRTENYYAGAKFMAEHMKKFPECAPYVPAVTLNYMGENNEH